MTARIVARVFPAKDVGDRYTRMARVLAWTAAQHCAGWEIDLQTIAPASCRSPLGIPSHEANTHKLDAWCAAVETARDGDRLALLDADAAIVGPLDAVWDQAFDLAYTVRPAACRLPLNAGVIFVRVSTHTRVWMRAWNAINTKMLRDPAYHQPWRRRFGGINQASLGAMLEVTDAAPPVSIAALPCAVWNCEDTAWSSFDPAVTRILHVKSQLRQAIFDGLLGGTHLLPIVRWWRAQERAALADAGGARVSA